MRNILRSMGLAKAAGALLSGEDTVRTAARGGKVKLVLLTADAGASTVKRARQIEELCGAPVLELDCSKYDLGGALGLSTVSIAAVTDAGFAKMLSGKIEKYKQDNTPPQK